MEPFEIECYKRDACVRCSLKSNCLQSDDKIKSCFAHDLSDYYYEILFGEYYE